jgi:hypothetical protein
MYEKGGYLTDTKETSTSYITHVFIPKHYDYIPRNSHLAHRDCTALWETKEAKRLQFNESVPRLKGINNSDCGMLELLYNSLLVRALGWLSFWP